MLIRIVCAVAFFAIMAVAKVVVTAAAEWGMVPWLILMAGVFWFGIAWENRERRADGRPAYSWHEARELIAPLGGAAALFAAIYLLR